MSVVECHEAGKNGSRPKCLQSDVLEGHEERLNQSDRVHGEMARDIGGTRTIANRVLEEVLAVKGGLQKFSDRMDDSVRSLDRRIDRVEQEETLNGSSAVSYSHEALARKYEGLKSDISQLKLERDAARMAKDIAAAEKREAEEKRVEEAKKAAHVEAELLVAQAKARKLVLAGYAAAAAVVIGAIATAVVQVMH